MRKFEPSQKDESKAQSADSSEAYRKRRAFIGNSKHTLDQGFPTWGTCTLGAASAYLKGYI